MSNFVDESGLHVKGGNGGAGAVSFRREARAQQCRIRRYVLLERGRRRVRQLVRQVDRRGQAVPDRGRTTRLGGKAVGAGVPRPPSGATVAGRSAAASAASPTANGDPDPDPAQVDHLEQRRAGRHGLARRRRGRPSRRPASGDATTSAAPPARPRTCPPPPPGAPAGLGGLDRLLGQVDAACASSTARWVPAWSATNCFARPSATAAAFAARRRSAPAPRRRPAPSRSSPGPRPSARGRARTPPPRPPAARAGAGPAETAAAVSGDVGTVVVGADGRGPSGHRGGHDDGPARRHDDLAAEHARAAAAARGHRAGRQAQPCDRLGRQRDDVQVRLLDGLGDGRRLRRASGRRPSRRR